MTKARKPDYDYTSLNEINDHEFGVADNIILGILWLFNLVFDILGYVVYIFDIIYCSLVGCAVEGAAIATDQAADGTPEAEGDGTPEE